VSAAEKVDFLLAATLPAFFTSTLSFAFVSPLPRSQRGGFLIGVCFDNLPLPSSAPGLRSFFPPFAFPFRFPPPPSCFPLFFRQIRDSILLKSVLSRKQFTAFEHSRSPSPLQLHFFLICPSPSLYWFTYVVMPSLPANPWKDAKGFRFLVEVPPPFYALFFWLSV